MSAYDNWLASGDPANQQFLCPICGDDSAETGTTRGKLPDNPVHNARYTVERKLECGCWVEESLTWDAGLGWV